MTILTDIGGTYARFALAGDNGPENIQKYTAADFPNLQAALAQYCAEHGVKPQGKLRIATAAHENEQGFWIFVNNNKWVIEPAALKNAGWDVECIWNDFEAATWALSDLQANHCTVLKAAKGQGQTKCLLGPGTGLGLGYLHEGAHSYVQKTLGGHMPAVAISEEQQLVMRAVQTVKEEDTIPVFEDVLSGRGLYNLYAAHCLMSGKPRQLDSPDQLLDQANNPQASAAIRLFHEFLGLFCANAVVTGNAYGGLYLNGGILRRLQERDLFDFASFEQWFCVEVTPTVKQALQDTPIIYVSDPFPALRGLMHA